MENGASSGRVDDTRDRISIVRSARADERSACRPCRRVYPRPTSFQAGPQTGIPARGSSAVSGHKTLLTNDYSLLTNRDLLIATRTETKSLASQRKHTVGAHSNRYSSRISQKPAAVTSHGSPVTPLRPSDSGGQANHCPLSVTRCRANSRVTRSKQRKATQFTRHTFQVPTMALLDGEERRSDAIA
jgi:hypothetical protein